MIVRGLLHVAVLADGGEEVGRLEELVLRNAGDALDHLRRVARVLLLQQLEDAARMLQRQIVGDVSAAALAAAADRAFAPAGPCA